MRTALPVRSAAAEAKDVVMRAAREVLAPILMLFLGCCWLLLATLLQSEELQTAVHAIGCTSLELSRMRRGCRAPLRA